jgi:hypothetical protein
MKYDWNKTIQENELETVEAQFALLGYNITQKMRNEILHGDSSVIVETAYKLLHAGQLPDCMKISK